jgi:hypothetical protein
MKHIYLNIIINSEVKKGVNFTQKLYNYIKINRLKTYQLKVFKYINIDIINNFLCHFSAFYKL